MKKVVTKKAVSSSKLAAWKTVGGVVLGLLLILAVAFAVNRAQVLQSDARNKRNEVEKCEKDEIAQVNKKGNIACVKKPKTEIEGKTGCKNGEKEYTDTDGKQICMAKCKTGYQVGENRETGKLGCVKTSTLTKIKCNDYEVIKTINGKEKCVCIDGRVNVAGVCILEEKNVVCKENQTIMTNEKGEKECDCNPGYFMRNNRCIETLER